MSIPDVSTAPRQSPAQAWSGHTFRTLLATLSRPGHIELLAAPAFLDHPVPVACWVPLALASRDTTIALVGLSAATADEIVERTGARLTDTETAELIAFTRAPRTGELTSLARGTATRPEAGASAAVEVASLASEQHPETPALRLDISGPGVAGTITVLVAPGDTDLDMVLGERQRACGQPPTGIDLWLLDGDGRVLGLPRSSTITWKDNH
ncbi:phosphonate C-P lyase system protein PhnH [Nocardia sp. NPDC004711]